MLNPFPGMNPYMENSAHWRGIHTRLIVALDEAINQQLPSPFVSSVEERVYMALPSQYAYPDLALVERPTPQEKEIVRGGVATLTVDAPFTAIIEEEVFERYLTIRAVEDGERIIAVIEILSPTNKAREAYGRDAYRDKRDQFIQSNVHFVEIDLLRDGLYSVAIPRQAVVSQAGENWQYLVRLHYATPPNRFDFWPISLRSRLPRISIPLTEGFSPVAVDLQQCLDHVYNTGNLERRIDYSREPVPPLSAADTAWADALLKEKAFR